jgi:hypothetical protein
MIKVNGVRVKTPSVFNWGVNDVSASDAGRTTDALMHKNRVGRKRKIGLQWNGTTPEETKAILAAFSPEYFNVTYYDPLAGHEETRTFYAGDMSAPVKIWTVRDKVFEQVSFDIIER